MDPDGDTVLRMYVPKHPRTLVIKQYHDDNGHMGVQKTFDSIRQKYFWPNLFKELYQYVSSCTVCQTRSLQKIRQPLQETNIIPFPMAKLSLDLSGPYPKTMSGNKYIIAFVDWFSGLPEAFAVPDKTADTVSHLLIEELYPRFVFLFIVTPIVGVCNCSMFYCTLLYVHSSIAIILMGKRDLVALLNLSSWCLVMVEWLFLTVPLGCLLFVIVVFPEHTHLLFWMSFAYCN